MIIVRVPGLNGLGKTKGTREAGRKILESFEGYRHEEIHVDNNNLEEQELLIRKNAIKLFGEEDRVVFVGGDHSISFPLVDSFRKVHPDGKLIVFDAHADCMKPMKEPTHEEWLRAVIDAGFKGENVLIIGASKIEREEMTYLEKEKIIMVKPEDAVGDIGGVTLRLKEFCDKGDIYVSFDIDVFESAKATGYPEGKMKEEEVMKLLDVVLEGNVVGMDLVEVNTEIRKISVPETSKNREEVSVLDIDEKKIEETLRLARKVLRKFIKELPH